MRILEKKRSKYFRKFADGTCDFCNPKVIKDQEIKQLEGKYWMVLTCKYPYMNGNLMIMPKRCVTHTDKLNKEEWAEFPKVWIKTQKLLSRAFKTNSFNLAMNLGPYSGGTIRHLHLMIVPRPDIRNLAAFNVFHNFYFVSMDYKELQRKLKKIKL